MSKKVSKKQAKALMEAADGDPYVELLTEAIINIQNNIGKLNTLAKDELEFAKQRAGLNPNVSKAAVKRQKIQTRRARTPEDNSLMALKKFINKSLNILFNSRFTFNFDGKQLVILDVEKGIQLEHRFLHLTSRPLMWANGFMSKWIDVFELEERFKNDINLKKGEVRVGKWVRPDFADMENGYGAADYNLMEGGFVDVPEATYKKYDMIPSLLCRNEFVFTQEATRGAGKEFGYRAGAEFLQCLMDFYEQEAKKYPHKR